MNMKQKLTYMLIGCLFTLAGFVLSSLFNTPTNVQAQDEKKAVFDKIVCKKLEIVNGDGKRVVSLGSLIGVGIIDTFNAEGTRIVHIGALGGKFGYLSTYNADSVGKKLVEIGSRDGKTGHLTLFKSEGADGEMNVGKILVNIWSRNGKTGLIETFNAGRTQRGKRLVCIDSSRDGIGIYDGLIHIYNHKGEGRIYKGN